MQSQFDIRRFDTLKSDSVVSVVNSFRSPDISHNFINSHRVLSNGLPQRLSDTAVRQPKAKKYKKFDGGHETSYQAKRNNDAPLNQSLDNSDGAGTTELLMQETETNSNHIETPMTQNLSNAPNSVFTSLNHQPRRRF